MDVLIINNDFNFQEDDEDNMDIEKRKRLYLEHKAQQEENRKILDTLDLKCTVYVINVDFVNVQVCSSYFI